MVAVQTIGGVGSAQVVGDLGACNYLASVTDLFVGGRPCLWDDANGLPALTVLASQPDCTVSSPGQRLLCHHHHHAIVFFTRSVSEQKGDGERTSWRDMGRR